MNYNKVILLECLLRNVGQRKELQVNHFYSNGIWIIHNYIDRNTLRKDEAKG